MTYNDITGIVRRHWFGTKNHIRDAINRLLKDKYITENGILYKAIS